MLPYYPQPVFAVGPVRIHAFALFAIAAILAARWMVLRRARRFGVGYEEIAPLYLTVVIAGLAGAAAEGLFTTGRGLISHGAVFGGVAGGIACCRVQRLSWARSATLLDIAAFAAPFAAAIGRLGCTVAHDHRGLPSHGWLAFHFPERARYDLGFVDFLFLGVLSLAFLALDRKQRRPPMFYSALAAASYGGFRIWRATLDVNSDSSEWAIVCGIGVATLVFCLGHVRMTASPPSPEPSLKEAVFRTSGIALWTKNACRRELKRDRSRPQPQGRPWADPAEHATRPIARSGPAAAG